MKQRSVAFAKESVIKIQSGEIALRQTRRAITHPLRSGREAWAAISEQNFAIVDWERAIAAHESVQFENQLIEEGF